MKNKSVINTPLNSAVLLPTSGNRDRNTLSQLAANHVSSPQRSSASPVARHSSNHRYHCRFVLPAKRPSASDKYSLPPCPAV